MLSFLDDLSDFFAGLFSSDPHRVQARKALRGLYTLIQSQKPLVYQKNSNELTPAFAQGYYNLFSLLLPFLDLFDRTINHKDKKIQEMSIQYYLESILVGDITQRRLGLSYEPIKTRLLGSPNLNTEISRVNTDFTNLIADVRRQADPSIDADVANLMLFKNLACHNMTGFFKKFGYNLADFGKTKPSFSAVDADTVLPDLLDLYYVLAPLTSVQPLERALALLLEKISPQTAGDQVKKLRKVLERVDNLLKNTCSPGLLLGLIRAIRKDPDFKAEAAKPEMNWFTPFVDQLAYRFNSDRDRAAREVGEDALTKDLAALFGNTELLSFKGYDGVENERLVAAGLDPFSMVKPLSVFKSFAEAVLRNFWLGTIKKLLMDAFWVEKDYGTKFGNQFYSVEGVFERMEALEASLYGEGKASHTTLNKHLKRDNMNAAAANRVVEAINKVVTEFLEFEAANLYGLAKFVGEALTDYKNPNPEKISNIKSLGGKSNREMIQSLLEGYNKTSQLLKILKNFIIIKGTSA